MAGASDDFQTWGARVGGLFVTLLAAAALTLLVVELVKFAGRR